ncbi:GtrA family protein [Streptomyces sp. GD-15H]|uniref:GtrA family protein n=1 Tax=Streptomyces sp. GD-15H TaxID=3129112 RepID=UPI003250B181
MTTTEAERPGRVPGGGPGGRRRHGCVGRRHRLTGRLPGRLGELARFAAVGGVAFTIDAGGANLMWWMFGDGGHLTGKALSALAATAFSFTANRQWTFDDRPHRGRARELGLFVLANVVATGVSLLCLGFTVYVLGLDSVTAKNVSANVVGVALGTALRYWTYQRWVFPHSRGVEDSPNPEERNIDSDAHSGHRRSGIHRLPVRPRNIGG